MRIFNAFNNWFSNLTGQGSTGDHGGTPSIAFRQDKSAAEITELLKHAPLIRVACEAMPEDVSRAWRRHEQQAQRWLALEEQYEMRDVVEQALFFSEGYGGAFVVPRYSTTVASIAALGNQKPVLKKGLLGFQVFAQHQLRAYPQTETLKQPNGLPQFYLIEGLPNVKIHYSWVYAVKGPIKLPGLTQVGVNGHCLLGQSRVDIIYDDFARMAAGFSALSHVLVKGNIDILKVKGLAEALARCESAEEMQSKIQGIVYQASATVTGANSFTPMVIDSEEALERKGGNHAGAADIVRELTTLFVAATRIPRTRLLGEQAKGMGNGGEADLTSYYDRCASFRERRCTGLMNWLDTCMLPGARTKWDYLPLWEMSAAELADVCKKQADADKIYIDGGIDGIKDAIRMRLVESPLYRFPVVSDPNATTD